MRGDEVMKINNDIFDFVEVFRWAGKRYFLDDTGRWTTGRSHNLVAGLIDFESDKDMIKLIKLMDGAQFQVEITDDEFREFFEGPGTCNQKSRRLYEQITGKPAAEE